MVFVGFDPHQCGLLTYLRLAVGGLAGITFLAQTVLLLGQASYFTLYSYIILYYIYIYIDR